MTKTYDWNDDDDDSEFEILHTHGSCKISAGCFEGDRLGGKIWIIWSLALTTRPICSNTYKTFTFINHVQSWTHSSLHR